MNSVFGLLLLAIMGMFDLFGRFFVRLEMASWFFPLITFIAVVAFLVKPLGGAVQSGLSEFNKRESAKRSSSRSSSKKDGD